MVQDYKHYAKGRNITFVSICTSLTATMKTLAADVEKLKIAPFATMLDAGGTTAELYNLPRNRNFQLVVIDGSGMIVYSGGSVISYMGDQGAQKRIHNTKIENSLTDNPRGILGEVEIPPAMTQAAHLYDLQQFGLMEQEIKRAAEGGDAGVLKCAEILQKRAADCQHVRLLEIKANSNDFPTQAYRESTFFADAFPNSDDAAAARELSSSLLAKPKVKREVDAELEYMRVVATELKQAGTQDAFLKLKPVIESYMKSFGTTRYAQTVVNAAEDRIEVVKGLTESVRSTPPVERRAPGGL